MPYASRPDSELYYEVHGDTGPTLIFAHGAGGNAASWWQQVMEFSNDHRVVVFDHRGFARSTCPPDSQRLVHFEDDLIAIMDVAGIESARIICQSMGGWTGVRTAVRHPDRVDAVLLGNTPGAVAIQATMDNLPKLRSQVGKGGGGLGGVAISREFVQRWPAGALIYQQISNFNPGRIPDFSDTEAYFTAEQCRSSDVPFWVLASDLDPLFPDDMLKAVADALGAEYRHVAGAGHSTYFEKPEAFNAILREFLAAT
jgi:3-oxoadipate enol-lactonase